MIYGLLVARKERKGKILLCIHHKIPCKKIKNEVHSVENMRIHSHTFSKKISESKLLTEDVTNQLISQKKNF